MTTSSPQVAVVTGANSGIGRATALHLAQLGYRVFGTVRSLDKAGKLQARANELGVSVELIELDVADDASVQRGFEDIFRATNRVDVLVNNAGIGGNGVVEESTSQMYHDAFNVNVVGAIRCTQQVLPNMRERKSGTIVNITSVVGKFAAIAQAPYVASKTAVVVVPSSAKR